MSDRRLAAQRAVVEALRGSVNAAIEARDNGLGQEAHDLLAQAELRLMTMEHVRRPAVPVHDGFDVIEE